MKHIYAALLILLFAASASGARLFDQSSCEELAAGRIIENNNFTKMRGLEQYLTLLGPEFYNALTALESNGLWLDGGAGEAQAASHYLFARHFYEHLSYERGEPGTVYRTISDYATFKSELLSSDERAISDYLWNRTVRGSDTNGNSLLNGTANVNAVSMRATKLYLPTYEKNFGKLSFLTDRYFESIPEDELGGIGNTGLISDVMGILAYSPRPDLVLEKYLRLLELGGKGFVFLGLKDDAASLVNHKVKLKKTGKSVPLTTWIKRVSGARARIKAIKLFGLPPSVVLILTRTNEPIVVPQLKLDRLIQEAGGKTILPPRRMFIEK